MPNNRLLLGSDMTCERSCTEWTNPDGTRCMQCQPTAGVPATRHEHSVVGWNAGANSVRELDGNVRLYVPAPSRAVGISVGLKRGRQGVVVPEAILYGWRFSVTPTGMGVAYVVESGVRKSGFLPFTPGEAFEIIRYKGKVRYYKERDLVHTSAVVSFGFVLTNACLYASGDTLL